MLTRVLVTAYCGVIFLIFPAHGVSQTPPNVLWEQFGPSSASDLTTIAFSPTANLIATGDQNDVITIRRGDTFRIIRTIDVPGNFGMQLTFSPSGSYLAFVNGNRFGICNVETGVLWSKTIESGSDACRFAISDEWFVGPGATRFEVTRYRTSDGHEVFTIPGRTQDVSPNGNLIAVSLNGAIRLHSAGSGAFIHTFGVSELGSSVSFSPDGTEIVSADGTGLSVWNVRSGANVATFGNIPTPSHVEYSPDGRYIAASNGLGSGSEVLVFEDAVLVGEITPNAFIWGIEFLPSSESLAVVVFNESAAEVYAANGTFRDTIPYAARPLRAISRDGRWFASGSDVSTNREVVEARSALSSAPSLLLDDTGGTVSGFSSDGNHLYTGGNQSFARIWETLTGNLVKTIPLQGIFGADVRSFSETSAAVMATQTYEEGTYWQATVVDIDTEKAIAIDEGLVPHLSSAPFAQISQTGTYIGFVHTSESAFSKIYRVATKELLVELNYMPGQIVFSPDENLVAIGTEVRSLTLGGSIMHLLPSQALSFSPNGKYIAISNVAGTLTIVDAFSGNVLTEYDEDVQEINDLLWTAGILLYSGRVGNVWYHRGLLDTTEGTTVEPETLSVTTGSLYSRGFLAQLTASDDVRLRIAPAPVFNTQLAPIEFEVGASVSAKNPHWIGFAVESQSTSPFVRQIISFYDFTENNWVEVGKRSLRGTDSSAAGLAIDDPTRFIEGGQVRAKISYHTISAGVPWSVAVDKVEWRIASK